MKTRMFVISAALVSGLLSAACTDSTAIEKPQVEPNFDLQIGKADSVSNTYTRIVGPLSLGKTIHDDVDYPDYYLGRTIELRAAQKIHVKVVATRKSEVRFYGPSKGMVNGVPTFGAAVYKGTTKNKSGKQTLDLDISAKAAGSYLIVYTPVTEWDGGFDITAECKANCLRENECLSNDSCGADQFCGDNGVRCIRAPCDVNYNICRPRGAAGASCTEDRACQEGLSCGDGGLCAVVGNVEIGGACSDTALCANGFCGCADNSCATRVCKPFAAEGEVCGGFRMASAVTFCDTNQFDCVGPVFIADIPGRCGERTTVAALLANPTAFAGHYVAIVGTVAARGPICTKMACSPANPCCNQCGASLLLWDSAAQVNASAGLALNVDGVTQGCSGNECTVMDHCSMEEGSYFIGGWFSWDGYTGTLKVSQRYGAPGVP